jgi:hypothetical protein
MYLFRGDVPRKEFAATLPAVLRPAFKLVGKRFMPEYPFEEGYFLNEARQFRAALKLPIVLLGGITKLETIEQALDEGFDFVAMGRALLREPDLPNRMREGSATESICIHCNKCMPTIYPICIHCNKCMPTIYRGTHCVLVDPDDRPGFRLLSQNG